MTKPVAYCKFVLNYPKLSFALALSGHVLAIMVTMVLQGSGYDILPMDFTKVPMDLYTDETRLHPDAWNEAASDSRVNWQINTASRVQDERSQRQDVLILYYESQNKANVITKENLITIKNFEDSLFNNSAYQSKICWLEKNKVCKKPLSLVRFFDGTFRALNPVFYDPNFDNIPTILEAAKDLPVTRGIIEFQLGKDASVGNGKATASIIRSSLYAGYPLKGFRNTADQSLTQEEKARANAKEAFSKILDSTYKNGLGGMSFRYNMQILFAEAIESLVIGDLLLVVASFLFIFIFMLCQTQSLWITSWGLFSIVSSFFGANLIYRIVLDYRYVGVFHVLSVFIIAGIGADDVFVFLDTWRAAKSTHRDHSFLDKLSFTYRHAAGAMLITSTTTFVAFMSNALSPLLAVSSFGVFSALIVMVNYLSVIIFFPTVVVTHELFWTSCKWPCCRLRCCRHRNNEVRDASLDAEQPRDITQTIAQFLGDVFYSKVVIHRIVRWVTLALFVALVVLATVFATKLKPDEEQIEIIGPGTNWYDVRILQNEAFPPSKEDRVVKVYIVWGLQTRDRSSCHFTDYKCTGSARFDESFDMNPPPCQTAMLKLCKKLKSLPAKDIDEMKIRLDPVTMKPVVRCHVDAMEDYYKTESLNPKYPNETTFKIPLTSNKVYQLMRYSPPLYNMSAVTDDFYRYYEVALAHWLTRGNTTYTDDYDEYSGLLGGEIDTTAVDDGTFQGGHYGNHLLYTSFVIDTILTNKDLAYATGYPVYRAWEDFVTKEMATFPPTCKNAFQTTPLPPFAWHWMKVQRVLVENATRGILISLCLTFPILLLMLGNWAVALLCILTISCITVGVIGFITMFGWKLGVLESLNLTLVVGLAVDYVVHLADCYVNCPSACRLDRVKFTLGHVGISVISGACTTLGAAMFMFAAKILFFFQFGAFIFCTIGLSLLFSLFLFTILLGLVGPQGSFGSLAPFYEYIKDWMRGKGKNDVPCMQCDGKGFHHSEKKTCDNNNPDF
ncbi:protein dispatched homolog 3 [Nematostella vectensis]|uniref:protein dispatched homolog 3 n=1 Tax=Nematostella vectensis TaxID=45351 RepID=UPI00138FD775|nr:protein dispatched homolog 3 [Nematostella vectensis]